MRSKLTLALAGVVLALCPMLMAPTGGFPSRPIFSGLVTTTATGAGSVGGFYVNAAQPSIAFRSSSAAANAKVWDITANATDLLFRTPNDALSVSKVWLDVTRVANVPTAIVFGNATDLPSVTAASNSFTVNGTVAPRIIVNGTSSSPAYQLNNAGVVKGYFCLAVTANNCVTGDSVNDVAIMAAQKLRLSSDGGTTELASFTNALINLTATAVQANGVPIATGTTGTFSITLIGMSSGGTGTVSYRTANGIVSLYVTAAITGTSNTTSMGTASATLPVALRPSNTRAAWAAVQDNGAGVDGRCSALADGSMAFSVGANSSGFTSSGTKGLTIAFTCTYPIG